VLLALRHFSGLRMETYSGGSSPQYLRAGTGHFLLRTCSLGRFPLFLECLGRSPLSLSDRLLLQHFSNSTKLVQKTPHFSGI